MLERHLRVERHLRDGGGIDVWRPPYVWRGHLRVGPTPVLRRATKVKFFTP